MFNYEALSKLARERRREVAGDVALCHHVQSPRIAVGRMLVAAGALAVLVGSVLDDESERKPEITVA
jgi:hypothetical protein